MVAKAPHSTHSEPRGAISQARDGQAKSHGPLLAACSYALLAGLWVYFTSWLLSLAVADSQLIRQLEQFKGLLFIFITGALLYAYLRRNRDLAAAPPSPRKPAYLLLSLLLTLALVVPLVGYCVLKVYSPYVEEQAYSELAAVSELTAEKIGLWRREGLRKSTALARDEELVAALQEVENGDSGTRDDLARLLLNVKKDNDYLEAAIIGSDGVVLVSANDSVGIAPAGRALLDRARRPEHARQRSLAISSDIYPAGGNRLGVDFLAPIKGGGSEHYLLLRSHLDVQLSSLRTRLPRRIANVKTLLVQRGSDELWPLGVQPDGAAMTGDTALRGALDAAFKGGSQGLTQATSDSGRNLYAAFHRVNDSPWAVAAIVDAGQALQPLRRLAAVIAVIVLLSLLLIALVLVLMWRRESRHHRVELLRSDARHEKNLREQEQVYYEMFEANPHAMWVLDLTTLRFLAVNQAAVQRFGYSRAEFMEMAVEDLLPPQISGAARESALRYFRAQTEDKSAKLLTQHRCKFGELIDVELTAHQLRFHGKAAALVLVYDVTERLRLESDLRSSNEFTKGILDALSVHILVVDPDGQLVATNRAWRKFRERHALGDDLVVGSNYYQSLDKMAELNYPGAQRILHGLRAILDKKTQHFIAEIQHDGGGVNGCFQVQIRRFHDGKKPRAVIYFDDISDRKQGEQELRKLNRYYAALSKTNRTIVRGNDAARHGIGDQKAAILEQACQIAVEYGELESVWVGKLVPGQCRMEPVAAAGSLSHLLGETLSLDRASPVPVGVAATEQRVITVNQITPDSLAEGQEKLTVGSALICPINVAGSAWGEIAFYAREVNYFTPDLVHLLEGLTADLAYSLEMRELAKARARAEAQLLLHARIIESSHEGMFITDAEGRITMANKAMTTITGYSQEELLGQTSALLQGGLPIERDIDKAREGMRLYGRWDGETFNRRKNGEAFPVSVSLTRVKEKDDRYDIAVYRDLSEQRKYEERIAHIISHDVLTDLPHRSLFDSMVDGAIGRCRLQGERLAVIFIDIDRLKQINDSLGHGGGDQLIQHIASRLIARCGDPHNICRVAGGEFAVLLPQVDSEEIAAAFADQLVRLVSTPSYINGNEVVVTGSAGIALYPLHGADSGALSRCAETAMRHAKQTGRNHYRFYADNMEGEQSQHLAFENALRAAIGKGEMQLAYQPQVNLRDQRVVGVEALARWNSAEFGNVPPGQFIPLAERSGIIIEIGKWALREACRQAAQWRKNGLFDVPISVNVSWLQFCQDGFFESVQQALEDVGLPPQNLELEITESLLMHEIDQTLAKLNRLSELGVQLAIDDFGTGYSSLSYLRQLPAKRLKIDKSFVSDLPDNKEAASIVNAVIDLAANLDMCTVAEGIETPEQFAYLQSMNCDDGQGYLISHPLNAAACEKWLAEANSPLPKPRLGSAPSRPGPKR